MGFMSFFRNPFQRTQPTPKSQVVVERAPVDLQKAFNVTNQSSFDTYWAPIMSVSGQPQNWSWNPKPLPDALPNSWKANWNAMYPVFRPYYGMALNGGVSKQLLRQIYEELEGHSPEEGAHLVNVMHENGVICKIEGGQLVVYKKNYNGTFTVTPLVNLQYTDAPVAASSI